MKVAGTDRRMEGGDGHDAGRAQMPSKRTLSRVFFSSALPLHRRQAKGELRLCEGLETLEHEERGQKSFAPAPLRADESGSLR